MPTNRTGLQKDISAIFADVPIRPKTRLSEGSRRIGPALTRVSGPPQTSGDIQTQDVPKTRQPVWLSPEVPSKSRPPETAAVKQVIGQVRRSSGGQVPRRGFERPKTDKLHAPKTGLSQRVQRARVVLVIILSIVLIALLARIFYAPSQNAFMSTVAEPAKAQLTARPNIKIDWPIPPVYPKDIRDPMRIMEGNLRTSAEVEAEAGRPIVRGIVHSENRPFAVIDKQLRREGEEVFGATIVKIRPDSVEFEMNGKRWIQQVEGLKK